MVIETIETGEGAHGVVTSVDAAYVYITNTFENTVSVTDNRTRWSQRCRFEEITKQHRIVFVVNSEETAPTLETFARERNCLVDVMPGRGSTGTRGSWLVFEPPEKSPFPAEELSYEAWPGPGDSEGDGCWDR